MSDRTTEKSLFSSDDRKLLLSGFKEMHSQINIRFSYM